METLPVAVSIIRLSPNPLLCNICVLYDFWKKQQALTVFYPTALKAVGVLFSPMVSGWVGGWTGGGK